MEVSKPKSSPNYPSGQRKGFCHTPCLRDLSDPSCTAIQDSSCMMKHSFLASPPRWSSPSVSQSGFAGSPQTESTPYMT